MYKYLDERLYLSLKRELDSNPLVMGDLMKFLADYTHQYIVMSLTSR